MLRKRTHGIFNHLIKKKIIQSWSESAKLHRPVIVANITNTNKNTNQFEDYIINDARNIKNVPFKVASSIAEMTKRQHECPLWGHLRRNRITAS